MDLSYNVYGKGAPIVLIHSPGVDSREWKYIVPILAKHYQVITYDSRGTGSSPASYAPLNLVEDLKLLFDHLDLRRATLLGHSMGGQTATEFTLAFPVMVDRLLLLAPSLTGFPYSSEFLDWMMQINSLAPDINKMVELSVKGPNYKIVMSSKEREFFIEMHAKYMTRVFSEWKSFEVNWAQPPAIERLETIIAPTLFINGDVEWEDMNKVAEQFKRIPNIVFTKIANADHMLALTHPHELTDVILRFMNKSSLH